MASASRRASSRRTTRSTSPRWKPRLDRRGATPQDVIAADIAFHCGLLRASHNELLDRIEGVIEATLRGNHHVLHNAAEWQREVGRHRLVADAVRDRDAHTAEQAMRHLLTDPGRRLAGTAV